MTWIVEDPLVGKQQRLVPMESQLPCLRNGLNVSPETIRLTVMGLISLILRDWLVEYCKSQHLQDLLPVENLRGETF